MDSKVVNAEIRRVIRPLLKDAGFTTFVARNAWRRRGEVIDVVNFQSFSVHLAERLRCTTFSFGVNLGVYYMAVHETPWCAKYPRLLRSRPERPAEHCCPARHHLSKRLTQPMFPRQDIWFVPNSGEGLEQIVGDAKDVIADEGLQWLEEFSDRRRALCHFLKPRNNGNKEFVAPIGTLAGARDGAPVALSLGDIAAARELWRAVASNPHYAKMQDFQEEAAFCLRLLQ
jgi:hypothetical protein